MTAPRATAWTAAAALLSGLSFGLVVARGQPLTFPLGPADHEYTRGFQRERKVNASRRWAKAEARIEIPLRIRRPSRLIVTGGRPGLAPARIGLQQDGQPVQIVDAGPELADHVVEIVPADALRLSLHAPDTERNLSLEVSRVTILPGSAAAVVPDPSVMARMVLGVAALCAVLLAAGYSGGQGLILSLGILAVPLSLVGLSDPFSALHLARKASLFVPLLAAPALLLPREQARLFVPVLAAALALRCLVFHPRYDYQDVEIHHQVTRVASRAGASELWSRMTEYQQRFDLGRASSGSGMKPFPYPPTFYSVAALVPLEDTEEAMKLLALAAQGLCVLLVMTLAGRLVGPGPPQMAAGLLALVFPPDLALLLRASYPAILGHAVDLAVVSWLFCRFTALSSARGVVALALALAAAALTYNAAPVHFALFVPILLLALSLRPALKGRWGLALAALGGGVLSLVYYGPFLRWTLERAVEGHAWARAQTSSSLAVAQVAGRWDKGALPYLIVSAAGAFVLMRRTWPRAESRVLLAWVLYPALILLPLWLSPEPFRYFRPYYFAYPLFPILAAALAFVRRGFGLPVTVVLLGWGAYLTLVAAQGFFS